MNANRKMTSLTRRIHRMWSHKLFRTYLLIDLLVLVLALYGFCYAAESVRGGFVLDRMRGISFPQDAFLWLEELPQENGLARTVQALDFSRIQSALMGATYRFVGPDELWVEVPMELFLGVLGHVMKYLLLAQAVLWLINRLFGTGAARRALKPLSKMTQTAQKLSAQPAQKLSAQPAPERPGSAAGPTNQADRLHDLQDAISSLSPERHGVRLSTGDKELKGLEAAINSLLERMRVAYGEQARFVSDASHELRTPIAVIQGYANMLDRWGKQDESILDESIAAIKSESEHMKALVEQLLFLARGDSDRQAMDVKPFDLSELVSEVHDEYEMIDQKHDWKIDAPGHVACVGDEGMIKQVTRILTDNAVKYTPPGGAIWLRAFEKDGAACFSVQDSGIGIDSASAAHIFERFFRADVSRASKPGADARQSGGKASGTGLGLSIAKWIVERHGGFFEVRSWPDLGTRITVCIPSRPSAEAE